MNFEVPSGWGRQESCDTWLRCIKHHLLLGATKWYICQKWVLCPDFLTLMHDPQWPLYQLSLRSWTILVAPEDWTPHHPQSPWIKMAWYHQEEPWICWASGMDRQWGAVRGQLWPCSECFIQLFLRMALGTVHCVSESLWRAPWAMAVTVPLFYDSSTTTDCIIFIIVELE